MARTSRNPQHYTVGIPNFFIYQQENEDDDRRVDCIALLRAYAGIVDAETGKVLNADDISTCMTPEQIMEAAYVGNITSASLGGEITVLDHTASVEGRKEIDKRVLLRRSLSYTLGFDEPAGINLKRFFSSANANFPLHRAVTGKTTASGTQSRPSEFVDTEIMVMELDVTNLGTNLSLLEDIITQNLQLKGVNLEPLKVGEEDVPYASVIYFLVGDTQRTQDVEVALEPYRNKVLCAFFKYDPTAGKLKVQNWPGSGMNSEETTYERTNFDERVMVVKQPLAETIVGIRTNGTIHDGTTGEISMEAARWDFNEGSATTHKLKMQLPENVVPGTIKAVIKGKKYDVVGGYWQDYSETLRDYIQAPDNAPNRYILRTGVIANSASTAAVVYNLALHPELAAPAKKSRKARAAAVSEPAPLADTTPTLTVSGDFAIADNGTASGTVTYKLTGENTSSEAVTFADDAVTAGEFTDGTHINISGVPSGITISNTVAADTLTLTASGQTTVLSPAVINITFEDAAFQNCAANEVAGAASDITVPYGTNDAEITVTNNLVGDGTNCVVTGTLEFNLTGKVSSTDAKFVTNFEQSMMKINGLPAGLTPTVLSDQTTDTKIVMEVAGTVNSSEAVSKTFTAAFEQSAFASGDVRFIKNATSVIDLTFVNNDAAMTVNNTFQLSDTTAGAIDGNALFNLAGEVMGTAANFTDSLTVGDVFVEGTHYNITGVPSGMTAELLYMSPLQARLTLKGTTTDTGEALVDIEFLDDAFKGNITAAEIVNGNPEAIKIELDAPIKPEGTINWSGTFKGLEDRTLSGFLAADLTGTMAEFTKSVGNGEELTLDTHFAVTGIPAEMTVKATKVTEGRVIFMIEGTAPESGGDQYSPVALPLTVGFRFLDGAFEEPLKVADVTGVSQQNIRITFPVAARVDTGESYFTDTANTFVNHQTGEVEIAASKVLIADSGETVGGLTEQSLEVSVSYTTIVGQNIIFSGILWGRETDALTTLRANRGKNEVNGPALVVHQNDVGVSMIHAIPKAVLRPDGQENYAKDDWMAGGFILDTVKDGEAYVPNLTRRVRIPFGWTITYKYRRVEY